MTECATVPREDGNYSTQEDFDRVYSEGKDVWTKGLDEALVRFLPRLTGGKTNLEFFVPLCGKCPELVWLADQGHHVTGVEWSAVAIKQFFEENKLEYSSEPCTLGSTQAVKYTAKTKDIAIYCCDFLAIQDVGQYDCVWDTASIGVFDPTTRPKYAQVFKTLAKPGGKVLLCALDYSHREHPFPPYAVTPVEVEVLYGTSFRIQLVQTYDVEETLQVLPLREKGITFKPWTLSHFAMNYYMLTKI